jgi:hypothetical protein
MSLPGFTAAVTRSGSSIGTYKAGAGQALVRDICNTGLQPAAVVNSVGGLRSYCRGCLICTGPTPYYHPYCTCYDPCPTVTAVQSAQ